MIPITKPLLGEEEIQAATRVFRSGWLAQGSEVARFEELVAERVGARHGIAVSSGTAALHLGLLTLDVGPGDEVIVPALGFIATANVVCHCGALPIFVDVDLETYNLDPARLEAALTPRTKAILPVHQLGLACELAAIGQIARAHGLAIVEDSACALGADYRGTPVGAAGNLGCFSFHPRKVITTGEGGMIVTDDDRLAARARALRSHGITVSAEARHTARQVSVEPEVELVGFNYRLTDLQAAVGQVQMERLDAILTDRRALAARYTEALGGTAVTPPAEPAQCRHAYQSYMVLLPSFCTEGQRRQVMQRLLERDIATRPSLTAIHRQPAHCSEGPPNELPVTDEVARRGLMLPLYPGLTEPEQDRVLEALLTAVRAVLP